MTWHPLRAIFGRSEVALEKYLATALQPMNLRNMAGNDRQYIRTAVEQLGARTARSYRSFSSDVIRQNLDRETATQLLPLESICKREFECCVELAEMAEIYIGHLENGNICEIDTPPPNEISDDAHVDNIMRGSASSSASFGTQFIVALENLRPHENLLDIVVNEKCIRSPHLNNWISCFCRRRVSWRVIHEHLLHLVGPRRYSPVVRKDCGVGGILQHTGTVVIELYSRVVQAAHGGSLTIHVEEQPEIFTRTPDGKEVTSSNTIAPVTPPELVPSAQPSKALYSVEGHLEYVFRELIKNACVALLSQAAEVEVCVQFASNDTHVVVDVTNATSGLSLEFAGKPWLFGWTTNTSLGNPMSGFGVGLSASKVYMDLWGGRIIMYNTPGGGTTARVIFPKAPTEVLLPEGRHFPYT